MAAPRETDKLFVEELLRWSSANLRDFPWRRPENLMPYRVLVAELLLKRTTASAAAKVYEHFLDAFPNLVQLTEASPEELESVFAPVGLNKQRAKSTAELAQYLADRHGSTIPTGLKDLLDVPGIGAYSSRAVLSFGFDQPFAVVDGNVQRIFRRVFGPISRQDARRASDQSIADTLLPKSNHRQFNFALIDLGSLLCRPAHPKCGQCPLLSFCKHAKGDLEDPPTQSGIAFDVHEKRRERGISLAELARASGLSKTTVLNLEKGRTRPKTNTLERILMVLQ